MFATLKQYKDSSESEKCDKAPVFSSEKIVGQGRRCEQCRMHAEVVGEDEHGYSTCSMEQCLTVWG